MKKDAKPLSGITVEEFVKIAATIEFGIFTSLARVDLTLIPKLILNAKQRKDKSDLSLFTMMQKSLVKEKEKKD